MGTPGCRLIQNKEVTRQQRRQSRKENRAQIFNLKRNIRFEEQKEVEPQLSEADKLKRWRLQKKQKMDEEKLRRRPPFRSYINVKHTGTSPFRTTLPPLKKKGKKEPVINFIPTSGLVQKPLNSGEHKIDQPIKNATSGSGNRITRQTFRAQNGITRPGLEVKNTTNVKKPPPAKKIVQKEVTKPLQVQNSRIVKKAEVINPKKVTVVEKKAPQTKNVNTNHKKKTQYNLKQLNDNNKKITNKRKSKNNKIIIENKENLPAIEIQQNNNKCNDCEQSKRLTRSRSKKENNDTVETSEASQFSEPPNGPTFQSTRLGEETDKLQKLKETWLDVLEKEDNQLPEFVRQEILSVTGLTTLLIASKFEQFKSLIKDCAAQMLQTDVPQRIIPNDLEGFWEMMYLQVVQLHNKYFNLEKLMMNNWKDPVKSQNNKPKKPIIKTPMPKKSGRSRFQEFLNKKAENKKKQETNSSSSSSENDHIIEDITKLLNEDGDALNMSSLKNCLGTPKAVKNLVTARKSRRSSMNIIMSMSGVGKFDVSGTAVCASPKIEKKVMFTTFIKD